ncbi:hypothetical protein HF086_007651, partial [Spodoptera exigua]
MHVLYLRKELDFCIAPVDYVNNAILAAGWDSVQNRKIIDNKIPIYTVGKLIETIKSDEMRKMISPKSLYYACAVETSNPILFWLLTWIFHYIPAYFIDAIVSILGVRPKGLPSFIVKDGLKGSEYGHKKQ